MRSTKLIPYIRQSRKREKTISLDEQRRWIRSHPNVKLLPEIVEQGVSGSKHWRKRALGRAIEACERGEAGGIIVAWQDRLSRENGLATAEVWEALERAGARLVCAAEGLDTKTGDHEMLFSIKAAIARDQWKRYRDRFETAKREAVERGLHVGPAPFGYVRRNTGEPLRLNKRYAKAVEAAFELRAGGGSYGEIVRLLDRLAPGGPSGFGAWNRNTVTRLLSNRVYLGEARGGDGHAKAGAHPAVVSRKLFDIVQAVAKRREPTTSQNGTPSLLAGMARCGSCGYALDRNTVGGGYLVYRCRGRSASGVCEAPASAMVPALDVLVDEAVVERLAAYAIERRSIEVDVSAIHERIEEVRRKREPFEDPEYVALLGKEAALRALRRVDVELEALDAELGEAAAASPGSDPVVLPTGETYLASPVDGRRAVIARLFKAVTVSRAARGTALGDRVRFYGKGDVLPFVLPSRGRHRDGAKVEAGEAAA